MGKPLKEFLHGRNIKKVWRLVRNPLCRVRNRGDRRVTNTTEGRNPRRPEVRNELPPTIIISRANLHQSGSIRRRFGPSISMRPWPDVSEAGVQNSAAGNSKCVFILKEWRTPCCRDQACWSTSTKSCDLARFSRTWSRRPRAWCAIEIWSCPTQTRQKQNDLKSALCELYSLLGLTTMMSHGLVLHHSGIVFMDLDAFHWNVFRCPGGCSVSGQVQAVVV